MRAKGKSIMKTSEKQREILHNKMQTLLLSIHTLHSACILKCIQIYKKRKVCFAIAVIKQNRGKQDKYYDCSLRGSSTSTCSASHGSLQGQNSLSELLPFLILSSNILQALQGPQGACLPIFFTLNLLLSFTCFFWV